MRYYLAFDGGGTKLQGVLFDEDYRILSAAKTGGVNGTIHSREEIDRNIRQCVEEMLLAAGGNIPGVEAIYTSQSDRYRNIVREYLPCEHLQICGEGTLGVLTGGMTSGVCALAGTGSDVFYVEDGKELDVLGGWGYVMGDAGSGFDIGRRALELMFLRTEGLRKPGLLDEIIDRRISLESKGDIIDAIYHQPSPAHFVASFCKCVNEAAQAGDPVSQEILYSAGAALARQTCQMVGKHRLAEEVSFCTTGSVFRYCAQARRGFEDTLRQNLPAPRIRAPIFEPVIGGILYCMLQNGEPLDAGNYRQLRENCKDFLIESI